jgi:DNA replication protein DnaC
MNNNSTLEKMKKLKLYGMHKAFESALHTIDNQNLSADELLTYLIEAEHNFRETIKIKSSIHRAKFRYLSSVEEINFSQSRNLNKNQLMRLADCSFIEKKENVIITGATGVGKSYLASALGHQACIMGYKVRYYNMTKLFSSLKMSKADNSYLKEIGRIEKQDLLILDDFGLHPIDPATRLALLEIIEDRHSKSSTIIASQVPVSKWHELLGEQTIADAILDRIIHSSQRIELQGESLRKKQAKTT